MHKLDIAIIARQEEVYRLHFDADASVSTLVYHLLYCCHRFVPDHFKLLYG